MMRVMPSVEDVLSNTTPSRSAGFASLKNRVAETLVSYTRSCSGWRATKRPSLRKIPITESGFRPRLSWNFAQ